MLKMDRNSEISTMDFSSPSVHRLSLPEIRPQTFSKIATLHDQLNPLVTSATPLLALVLELKECIHTPDLKSLHELLAHEVQIMEQRALQQGYRSQVILAARYLICAYVDEMITNTLWGAHSHWQQHNLLSTFQHEVSNGEHFFLILERSAEEPQFYIDVIELGYICLKLGFEGKYQKSHTLELENITDNLYQLIRQTRGEINKKLYIARAETKPPRIKKWMWPSISSTIIAFIAIMLTIFIAYHERLDALLNPVQQSINNQLQQNGTEQNAPTQNN